jgi:hypothetical protein
MLLNLSNHPAAAWSPGQLRAVCDPYGAIQDPPFPQWKEPGPAEDCFAKGSLSYRQNIAKEIIEN